jgi:hypothetical protein
MVIDRFQSINHPQDGRQARATSEAPKARDGKSSRDLISQSCRQLRASVEFLVVKSQDIDTLTTAKTAASSVFFDRLDHKSPQARPPRSSGAYDSKIIGQEYIPDESRCVVPSEARPIRTKTRPDVEITANVALPSQRVSRPTGKASRNPSVLDSRSPENAPEATANA